MVPTLDVLATEPVFFPTLGEVAALLPETAETARFLAKVEPGPTPQHWPELGPCLMWTKACSGDGYSAFRGGALAPGGPRLLAGHLWLYHQLHGPVPAGMELDHVCHEPAWCRPPKANQCPHRRCVLHVVAKPVAANRLRADQPLARKAAQTHCRTRFAPRDPATGEIIGHDWTIPGNVRIRADGHRVCVPCEPLFKAEYAARVGATRARARARGLADAGQLEIVTG